PDADTRDAARRDAICAAGRRLGARGLISAAEGNLSIRLEGGVLLAAPHRRALAAPRPPPPVSMALTLAGEVPDPTALPGTAYHLPVLPLVPFGEMGSDELAMRIAAAFVPHGRPPPGGVLL